MLAVRALQLRHGTDPAAHRLLQASVREGKRQSINTDLMLKLLALDVCSETPIGNQMIRLVCAFASLAHLVCQRHLI